MELKKPKPVVGGARLIAPKRRVYDAVGDYQVSKVVTKKFPKMNDGDDVIAGNARVTLSEVQRVRHEAEQRLKAKRTYERERRKALDEQWKQLENNERQLRENFIKFNEFIKENETKRDRAYNRREYHTNLVSTRKQNTERLMFEYGELKELKKLMDKKLEEHQIYEEYLQKVVDADPEHFTDVMDVLKRYETLMHSKNFLSWKQECEMNELQEENDKLRDLVDGYHETMQMMHTKSAVLLQRYEAAKRECLEWELILLRVRNEAVKKMLEVDEVKTTSSAIYRQICAIKDREVVHEDDYMMQLSYIKKALQDFEWINKRARKKQRKELGSERATAATSSPK